MKSGLITRLLFGKSFTDTMPMVNALRKRNVDAKVIFYEVGNSEQLLRQVPAEYAAAVCRINPGNLPGGEAKWFDFLRSLSKTGVQIYEHPDVLLNLGAKELLPKLNDTPLVPSDTLFYRKLSELKQSFPKTLAIEGQRVLKQNRGSTGEGIWRVVLEDKSLLKDGPKKIPLDAKVVCTEAKDNHTETHSLSSFINRCEAYLVSDTGGLVDMAFLPRISEGELRLLLVGETPIFVVVKKPKKGEFSATLFSGAQYEYLSPDKFPKLMEMFIKGTVPVLLKRIGMERVPLIWCADFIRHWDENGNDSYVLGEINCSCVGFTSHLDQGIQDLIAKEIISRIK